MYVRSHCSYNHIIMYIITVTMRMGKQYIPLNILSHMHLAINVKHVHMYVLLLHVAYSFKHPICYNYRVLTSKLVSHMITLWIVIRGAVK